MLIPVDPIAALRITPITVTVADQEYTMPPRTAADWIEATATHGGSMLGYLPGLLDLRGRSMLAQQLMARQVPQTELAQATWEVLEIATGFEWWWVGHRLLLSIVAGWGEIGGWLLTSGLDPAVRPIGAVLLAVLNRAQESAATADKNARSAFYSQLCMPPREHPDYAELMHTVGSVVLADLAKQK